MAPARAGSPPGIEKRGPADLEGRIPADVQGILERLWSAGFEAYVVGGSLRDLLIGRAVSDWDVTTAALPEQTRALFPGSVYENRFGTVGVALGGTRYEVTTFRREHVYADHRRPERVEFGVDIDEDLARRDFTMNAIAWGRSGESGAENGGVHLHDPFGGATDLAGGLIRAVGRPEERFGEDALRMLRAIRFAATLGFGIEPATLAGIRGQAPLARHLSGERVQAELRRILAAPRASVALRLLEETGLLAVRFPELAAQRGIAQNKVPGQDLWDHTVSTVDAADPARPLVRLAALLHDVGKPGTLQDGHFPGHEVEGARIAEAMLRGLALPRHEIERVVLLVRHHMFGYSPTWSDAAVRRFLRRVGSEAVDDLLALREADNLGSGRAPGDSRLAELRERIATERRRRHPLRVADLAIGGDDVTRELGIAPGPEVGRILRALLERVIADPALNEPAALSALARRIHRRPSRQAAIR